MKHYYSACVFVLLALLGVSHGVDTDSGSTLSSERGKEVEKPSEHMNDYVKGANEVSSEKVITRPSESPSPTKTPTPSSSRTPLLTPSCSPDKNSYSKPKPNPLPSSSATVEVINKVTTATVPNDGNTIEVSVDFTGENVSAGQQVTLSSIQAAGDIPTTTSTLYADSETQSTTPATFLEFTFADGSTLTAVPVNQCNEGLGPVTFTTVGGSIELQYDQLAFALTVRAVGFGNGCDVEIEVVVTAETPIGRAISPTPVPSN